MEVQLFDAVTDKCSRLEHQQKENYRQNTTESFLPTKLDSQFELAGSAKIIGKSTIAFLPGQSWCILKS